MRQIINGVSGFFSTTVTIAGTVFPFTYFDLIVLTVLPLVAIYVLLRLGRKGARSLIAKSKLSDERKAVANRSVKLSGRIIYTLLAILLVVRLFGPRVFEYIGAFFAFLNEPFFTSGQTEISIVTIILMVPIFYLASRLAKVTHRFIDGALNQRLNLDASRRFSISNLVRYFVLAIALLIGLSIIGIDLSALTVIFGVLGIGLGFGLQTVVANFFAGIVIIVSRPIKEGDRIQVADLEGNVVHIRMLSTVVNTITNETIIVPNGHIIDRQMHNNSYEDPSIIIVNTVQVAYATDLDYAREVLARVGEESPHRMPGKPINVYVMSFDDSGITMALHTWIVDAKKKLEARAWVNLEMWRALKGAGITIPFPQMDLYVQSLPAATPNSEPDKTGS